MIRNGVLATTIVAMPVTGLEARAVLALELDRDGRLRGFGVKATPPAHESAEERAARQMAEGMAAKLRHIGCPHEALRRARMAVDFLENLVALEEAHGPQARDLLAGGASP